MDKLLFWSFSTVRFCTHSRPMLFSGNLKVFIYSLLKLMQEVPVLNIWKLALVLAKTGLKHRNFTKSVADILFSNHFQVKDSCHPSWLRLRLMQFLTKDFGPIISEAFPRFSLIISHNV